MESSKTIRDGVPFDPNICIFEGMLEPTGFDESNSNSQGDISFVNGTRTFTIEPKSGQNSFWYWRNGTQCTHTSSDTLVISDVEGEHYIYYDENDTLQESVNPSTADIDALIREEVLVAYIYWDATNNEYVWFNNERHLNRMDGNHHSYHHFINGTRWLSGGQLGDFVIDDTGADDEDAQFSVTQGTIADEDIVSVASALTSTNGMEILYKDSNGWRRLTQTGFSVLTDVAVGVGATGRLVYNNPGVGLVTVTNNDFVLCHVIQTNGETNGERFFAIVGQAEYNNIVSAREGATTEISNLITSGLAGPEFIFLGTVIFQTSNGYGNSVKARTRTTDTGENYVNWTGTSISAGTAPGNHANLTNLQWDASGHTIPDDVLLGIGNQTLGDTGYKYNSTTNRLELYVNGNKVKEWS